LRRQCGIIEDKMRLRTIALALALACGFTVSGQAKKNVIHPAAKSHRVKRASAKHRKNRKASKGKAHRRVARNNHR